MVAFIIRRLALSVVVLLVSTFLVFMLEANAGDPLATLRARQPPPPPATITALQHELHLDVPIPVRYFYWLGRVLHGDLGNSINGIPVRAQLGARVGITLQLVLLAMLLALLLAVVAGVVAAVNQYSALDYVTTLIGFVLISTPLFWFAGLLKSGAIWLNHTFNAQLVSFDGQSTPGYNGGFFGNLSDRLSHLILPTIALASIHYAAWSRYQRAAMLDVLGSDYIRLARAKGVRWRTVLRRHGARTAIIPLTTIVAVNFGLIIGGAVVTETVFNWHGMGELLINGVKASDTNVVLGWLLVSATAVVLANLIADILYGLLDPRIRHD